MRLPAKSSLLLASGAAALFLVLRPDPSPTKLQQRAAHTPTTPAVAVCISGASRGPESLDRFAVALVAQLRPPANTEMQAFIWLADAASEQRLERLLRESRRFGAIYTRLRDEAAGSTRLSEAEDIAAAHPAAAFGDAWRPSMTPNTLRMLFKWRGVEGMRAVSGVRHALVLLIRPDLELREALVLPSAYALGRAAVGGWLCDAERLASDQLLLLTDEGARRLGGLYEPAALRAALGASKPPSMYPERLVYEALRAAPGFELRAWSAADAAAPPAAVRAPASALLGATAPLDRDPYAKLRADFAPRAGGCEYPAWDGAAGRE